MYPRAKVSGQGNLIAKEDEAMDFILRVVESLSLEVHPPLGTPETKPETKYKVDPPAPHAKISISDHPKISPASSTSGHKGKITRSFHGDNKAKARASSVPRPRAVISSPDNDDLVGNQNRSRMERRSKPQISSKNMQSEVKSSHKNARSVSLSSSTITKEVGFSGQAKDKKIITPKVSEMKAKVLSQPEPRILVRREKSD